jgi:hypothetical protein
MWFLKEFKVSEILCVTTFDTSVYTITQKDPETQLGEIWKTWQTRNSNLKKNLFKHT